MKSSKRLLAMFLAIMMVVSILPISTLAASAEGETITAITVPVQSTTFVQQVTAPVFYSSLEATLADSSKVTLNNLVWVCTTEGGYSTTTAGTFTFKIDATQGDIANYVVPQEVLDAAAITANQTGLRVAQKTADKAYSGATLLILWDDTLAKNVVYDATGCNINDNTASGVSSALKVYGGGWNATSVTPSAGAIATANLTTPTQIVVGGNASITAAFGGGYATSNTYYTAADTYVEVKDSATVTNVVSGGYKNRVSGAGTVIIRDNATVANVRLGGANDVTDLITTKGNYGYQNGNVTLTVKDNANVTNIYSGWFPSSTTTLYGDNVINIEGTPTIGKIYASTTNYNLGAGTDLARCKTLTVNMPNTNYLTAIDGLSSNPDITVNIAGKRAFTSLATVTADTTSFYEGTTKEAIIATLPATVSGTDFTGAAVSTNANWVCDNYEATVGTYTFTADNVMATDDSTATVSVTVIPAPTENKKITAYTGIDVTETYLPVSTSTVAIYPTLAATVDGASENVNILWSCDTFAGEAGTYTYTAVLPVGYEFSGIAAPTVTVHMVDAIIEAAADVRNASKTAAFLGGIPVLIKGDYNYADGTGGATYVYDKTGTMKLLDTDLSTLARVYGTANGADTANVGKAYDVIDIDVENALLQTFAAVGNAKDITVNTINLTVKDSEFTASAYLAGDGGANGGTNGTANTDYAIVDTANITLTNVKSAVTAGLYLAGYQAKLKNLNATIDGSSNVDVLWAGCRGNSGSALVEGGLYTINVGANATIATLRVAGYKASVDNIKVNIADGATIGAFSDLNYTSALAVNTLAEFYLDNNTYQAQLEALTAIRTIYVNNEKVFNTNVIKKQPLSVKAKLRGELVIDDTAKTIAATMNAGSNSAYFEFIPQEGETATISAVTNVIDTVNASTAVASTAANGLFSIKVLRPQFGTPTFNVIFTESDGTVYTYVMTVDCGLGNVPTSVALPVTAVEGATYVAGEYAHTLALTPTADTVTVTLDTAASESYAITDVVGNVTYDAGVITITKPTAGETAFTLNYTDASSATTAFAVTCAFDVPAAEISKELFVSGLRCTGTTDVENKIIYVNSTVGTASCIAYLDIDTSRETLSIYQQVSETGSAALEGTRGIRLNNGIYGNEVVFVQITDTTGTVSTYKIVADFGNMFTSLQRAKITNATNTSCKLTVTGADRTNMYVGLNVTETQTVEIANATRNLEGKVTVDGTSLRIYNTVNGIGTFDIVVKEGETVVKTYRVIADFQVVAFSTVKATLRTDGEPVITDEADGSQTATFTSSATNVYVTFGKYTNETVSIRNAQGGAPVIASGAGIRVYKNGHTSSTFDLVFTGTQSGTERIVHVVVNFN